MRKNIFQFFMLMIFAWVLCGFSCFAKTNCWYYVSSDYAKGIAFRKDADGDSKMYERLPFGTEFWVTDEKGDWLKTKVNGNDGWIHKDYVSELEVDEEEHLIMSWYTVTSHYSKGIAIRDAVDGNLIMRLPYGTEVFAYQSENEWFYVLCEEYNVEGWMHSGYLKYDGSKFSTPHSENPDIEESAKLDKEMVDNIMYDYVYDTYGRSAENAGAHWAFSPVDFVDTPNGTANDYCYFVTSYTGAQGYYYVDSYTGEVWEQWRPPHLSEYTELSFLFKI